MPTTPAAFPPSPQRACARCEGHVTGIRSLDADGLRAGRPVQQPDHLLADAVQVSAELDEHLGGDSLALADEPEQDVLGADVVVAELERLTQRELKDPLGPRCER